MIHALFRAKPVIYGSNDHAVADEGAVADTDAALILKTAAGVDEDISADADVFAEVRVEGQKHSEAFINVPPSDAAHVFTDFFHVMHARIELLGEPLRLQRPSVHAVVGFRTCGKRFTLTEIFKQFFKFHIFLQEGAGAPFMPLPGDYPEEADAPPV